MPTIGTIPTQMRLTDPELAKLDAVKDRYGCRSRSDAVRLMIDFFADHAPTVQISPKKIPKNNRNSG